MNFSLIILRILILFFFGFSANAQKALSLGISGGYNIPLQTMAAGIRAGIPLSLRLELSPQVRYTPAFNDIHELSAGVNLHYCFVRNLGRNPGSYRRDSQGVSLYLIGGVHYNRWINYSVSLNDRANKNNILPEAGAGAISGGKVLKVFIEVKYNPLWLEPSTEAGLLVYPFNRSSKLKCFY